MRSLFLILWSTAAHAASPYDTLLEAEWRKAHLHAAPPVSDAGFLRRVSLDLAGELPPAEVVRAFLDDKAPDKRARMVDALLSAPRYADHFTDYWERILLGRGMLGGPVDRGALRDWLHHELAGNQHWDRMSRALIAAVGRNSDGGPRNPVQRARLEPSPSPGPNLNGAVNYVLRFVQQPEDMAGHYARVFLGVQIQCAQCHNHPSEKWKQDDFRKLAAAFARVRTRPVDDNKNGIRRVFLEDGPPRKGPKAKNARALAELEAHTLDGSSLEKGDQPARVTLADWTITRNNPWFARALVNRYWAYFLGRGFVDPIDDFRHTNPPVAGALLDRLAADFAAHDFDLQWLIRAICATRAYQLSPDAATGGQLWADYRLRPLDPEELLAALAGATGVHAMAQRVGGGGLDVLPVQLRQLFSFLFAVDEESDTDSFSGTLPQALFTLNGTLTNFGASARPGSTLAQVLALPLSDEQKIAALYLRALSRPPTPAETQRWLTFVHAPREAARHKATPPAAGKKQADPLEKFAARDSKFHAEAREQAWEDLFWALLNSSEFTFHH